MLNYVAVALGGMVGCCTRYALTQWLQALFGRSFPAATLIINVLGSFLMGLLFFLTVERIVMSPTVRTGILTGGLGGLTTFSTFSMEALLLAENGQTGRALLYILLSVVLGVTAAFVGATLARNL